MRYSGSTRGNIVIFYRDDSRESPRFIWSAWRSIETERAHGFTDERLREQRVPKT